MERARAALLFLGAPPALVAFALACITSGMSTIVAVDTYEAGRNPIFSVFGAIGSLISAVLLVRAAGRSAARPEA